MIQNIDGVWQSNHGYLLRRVSNGVTGHTHTALPADTADSFEEITTEPEATGYSKEAYRAEVEKLIAERYTTGQEIQFAREKEQAEGFEEYLAYVEECKSRAREELEARASEVESQNPQP